MDKSDAQVIRNKVDLRASYSIPRENIDSLKKELKEKFKQWCYTPITVLGRNYHHETWGENGLNEGLWYLSGSPWAKLDKRLWIYVSLRNGSYPAEATIKVDSLSSGDELAQNAVIQELFGSMSEVCKKYGTPVEYTQQNL